MVHKIFIYISKMAFLLRMKNDQVQINAQWVKRRDGGFVYAGGHQNLNGVAFHASVHSHLPSPLVVDKYPYLKETGDRFQAARLYRALLSSTLLISHIY